MFSAFEGMPCFTTMNTYKYLNTPYIQKMSMTGCEFNRFSTQGLIDLLAWRSRRLLLLAQRVLSGLQVAVATSCRFGGRFGAPLRVLAVLQVPHRLHVAATAHPSTGDLWTFGPASTQSGPVPQRDLEDRIVASVRLTASRQRKMVSITLGSYGLGWIWQQQQNSVIACHCDFFCVLKVKLDHHKGNNDMGNLQLSINNGKKTNKQKNKN